MTKATRTLFKNSIGFSPLLGKVFGVCGAMLIQQIHYFCSERKNLKEGHHWVYHTTEEWTEILMCWDEKTIRRTLADLRSSGIAVTGNYNKRGFDRTLWYRIDYEKLISVMQSRLPMWTFCPNGCGQNVLIEADKMSVPIPKTTSKTTEETTQQCPAGLLEVNPDTPLISEGQLTMAKMAQNSAKILLQQEQKKSAPIDTGKHHNNGASAVTIWKRLVPKHHPSVGMLSTLTELQVGKLRHFANRVEGCSDDVLKYVIPRWIAYAKFVESQSGLYKSPDVPNIGFLLTHASEALGFYKSAVQPVAPPKPIKPFDKPQTGSSVVCPTDEPKDIATIEDVLAYKLE